MRYSRNIWFNQQGGVFFLLNIRFFLIHLLFFFLGLNNNFKSLSCKLFLLAYTHVLGSWTGTLYEFITIIAFKINTDPRKLNPNPAFIVIIWWHSFELFIIIFKLLKSHKFVIRFLTGLLYLLEHRL